MPAGTNLPRRRRRPGEIRTLVQLQAALQVHLLIKVYRKGVSEFSIGADLVDPEVVAEAIQKGLLVPVNSDLLGSFDHAQQFGLAAQKG